MSQSQLSLTSADIGRVTISPTAVAVYFEFVVDKVDYKIVDFVVPSKEHTDFETF